MKTALDNYEVGKQKEVNAEDFSYVVKDHERFICPECLQPVFMAGGNKMINHFRHYEEKEGDMCDRRKKANAHKSISQKVGLPFFLRKEENKYLLNIGFRPLPTSVIDKCNSVDGYLLITNKNKTKKQKYYINYSNFSDVETVYKQVEFLDRDKLNIEYSSPFVKKLVEPFWSDYIETSIVEKGALFFNGNNGGKIIRTGDCISTYKEYIWMKPKLYYFYSNYKGFNFSMIGNISISNIDYEIYEGSFEISSSDIQNFSRLARNIKTHLGLFLIDSDSSITPIWPPSIRNEVGYFTKKDTDLFYVVNSNNDEPFVYIYTENSPEPFKTSLTKVSNTFIGKISVSSFGKTINIDRRVVSNGSYIKAKKLPKFENSYYIDDDLEIKHLFFTDLASIQFEIKTKVDIFLVDACYNIAKVHFDNGRVIFKEDKKIQSLWMVCNKKLVAVGYRENSVKKTQEYNTELFKRYSSNKEMSLCVSINSKIKKDINKLYNQHKELRKYLKPYMNSDVIPLSIVKLIRREKNEK